MRRDFILRRIMSVSFALRMLFAYIPSFAAAGSAANDLRDMSENIAETPSCLLYQDYESFNAGE